MRPLDGLDLVLVVSVALLLVVIVFRKRNASDRIDVDRVIRDNWTD